MSGPDRLRRIPGLERLVRTAMIVIPLGIAGNIVLSLLATDHSVLASVAAFPRGYLLLAVGLALIPWATNTIRLLTWTRFLGHRLRVREAFRITLAVDLGASVSPTAVGGEVFKWGMLVRRGVTPGAAALLTSIAKLEDGLFFALALPVAIAATSSWGLPAFDRIFGAVGERAVDVLPIVGAAVVVIALLLHAVLAGRFGRRLRMRLVSVAGRARRRVRTGWSDARGVIRLIARRGKARFGLNMCVTAVQWIARYSVISALIAFLGAPVDPVLFWVFQWVVFTLMSLIPTPGAAGGAEAAFSLVYGAALPAGIIGIATAGWRFLTFYLQVGIAAVLFAGLNAVRGRTGRPRAGTAASS